MDDVTEVAFRGRTYSFDGRVVEVFNSPASDAVRCPLANLEPPKLKGPNRKGRYDFTWSVSNHLFTEYGFEEDELATLQPLLDRLREAGVEIKS